MPLPRCAHLCLKPNDCAISHNLLFDTILESCCDCANCKLPMRETARGHMYTASPLVQWTFLTNSLACSQKTSHLQHQISSLKLMGSSSALQPGNQPSPQFIIPMIKQFKSSKSDASSLMSAHVLKTQMTLLATSTALCDLEMSH